jgi:hypothetical protein
MIFIHKDIKPPPNPAQIATRTSWRLILAMLSYLFAMTSPLLCHGQANTHRGVSYVNLTNWKSLTHELDRDSNTLILTYSDVQTEIEWTEAILSWNTAAPKAAHFQFEAQVIYAKQNSKYYHLGHWSLSDQAAFRRSVSGQADLHGDVETDTLVLKSPSQEIRLRLTIGGFSACPSIEWLKFLGIVFLDKETQPEALPAQKQAWGKVIDVPQKSQVLYEGGMEWCSPTCVSMVLNYWSQKLECTDLALDVPAAAQAIHDPTWPGTGNWSFNTALAGSFKRLRAYVTRLSDIAELEDWIISGAPVIVSVSYNILKGRESGGGGHLIVCVGFSATGDIIVNDPGVSKEMRRTFPRKLFARAWAHSRNTVYLIYPGDHQIPDDRFGHWVTD